MCKLRVDFLYASSAADMNTFCHPRSSSEKHAEEVECPISSIYRLTSLSGEEYLIAACLNIEDCMTRLAYISHGKK